MRVREYLERFNVSDTAQITFIMALTKKDEHTPFYHSEYIDTPIHSVYTLINENSDLLNYHILNDKQPPIDWLSCGAWGNWFNKGHLICMLVIDDENIDMLYPTKEQGRELIKSIEERIIERALK